MSLEVITGPMFSGKSEELLRRAQLCQIAGMPVIAFKPITDTRSETIKSRSGFELQALEVEYVPCSHIWHESIIVIDEAQFFCNKLIWAVEELLDNGNKIIISGLDTDFKRRPFGSMPELMAMAQKVTKLKAVCHRCKSFEACYTQRIVNGRPTIIGEQVLIGDTESYEARCLKCWMK